MSDEEEAQIRFDPIELEEQSAIEFEKEIKARRIEWGAFGVILENLWRRIKIDAQEAGKLGGRIDLGKLRRWAEACRTVDGELSAARADRLNRLRQVLWPGTPLESCACRGTGWISNAGPHRSQVRPDIEHVGPHVTRCPHWPKANNEFWQREPERIDRVTREAVCPAALRWLWEMAKQRRERSAGRAPTRND
jgi:hypothetical protein